MLTALALVAAAGSAPDHVHHAHVDSLTADEVAAHGGCATMALLARGESPIVARADRSAPPPDESYADLRDDDPFNMPNVVYSEHFAFRWGNRRTVTEAEARVALNALERAFNVQVSGMGHDLPVDMDGVYMNVYLADSHTSAPPVADGAAAYVTSTRDGQIFITWMESSLKQPDTEATESTAAHEFYHVVQLDTGRFGASRSISGWFYESTANWAAGVTYPGRYNYARNLYSYAFNPQKSLNHYGDIRESGSDSTYQYGAFLFPLYVSQQAKTFEVVADVWKDTSDNKDALEVMRVKAAELEIDLDDLWMEHVARNATWDYPDRSVYLQVLQDNQGQPGAADQFTIELDRDGTDGWIEPPEDLALERYGYHMHTLSRPSPGTYTFEIQGEERTSAGRFAIFGATLVLEPYEGDIEYRPIEFDGTSATLVADDLDDVFKVYLVVSGWTEGTFASSDEYFPYQLQVGYEGDGDGPIDTGFTTPPPEPPTASACSTGAVPGGLVLVGLGGLIGLLRRRRG